MALRRLFTGFSTNNVIPGSTKTTLYDLNLVKQDLLNQFMTRKGERVMLPNYGCSIWERLFEPFTETSENLIIQDVVNVINSEPRVTLNSVTVTESTYGITVDCALFFIPWNVVDTFNMLFDAENQPQF